MNSGTWNRIPLQSVDEIISMIIDAFAIKICKIASAYSFLSSVCLQELENK
jgi:hypothetical protein